MRMMYGGIALISLSLVLAFDSCTHSYIVPTTVIVLRCRLMCISGPLTGL